MTAALSKTQHFIAYASALNSFKWTPKELQFLCRKSQCFKMAAAVAGNIYRSCDIVENGGKLPGAR